MRHSTHHPTQCSTEEDIRIVEGAKKRIGDRSIQGDATPPNADIAGEAFCGTLRRSRDFYFWDLADIKATGLYIRYQAEAELAADFPSVLKRSPQRQGRYSKTLCDFRHRAPRQFRNRRLDVRRLKFCGPAYRCATRPGSSDARTRALAYEGALKFGQRSQQMKLKPANGYAGVDSIGERSKGTPLPSRSATREIRCERLRPSRSSLQVMRVSPAPSVFSASSRAGRLRSTPEKPLSQKTSSHSAC